MLDLSYSQFTGTVQVMKAVGNHLVLTFCETLPKSQMFTIILTRKPHLLSRDVSRLAHKTYWLRSNNLIFMSLIFFITLGRSISEKSPTTTRLECTICSKSVSQFLSDNKIKHYVDNYHIHYCIASQSKGLRMREEKEGRHKRLHSIWKLILIIQNFFCLLFYFEDVRIKNISARFDNFVFLFHPFYVL